MAYIIHGATGAQGSPILSSLRAAGFDAVAAVRNPGPAANNTRAVAVDLADERALTHLYEGADGIFIHLPLGPAETTSVQAQAIAKAVKAAAPSRVVISTSGQVVDEPASVLQTPEASPLASLIRAVEDTDTPTAVVAPRLFLENLLLPVVLKPLQAEGVLRYPLATDYPVSWASHADVAAVTVHLLTGPAHTGVTGVGALPGLTGTDLAESFSAHLGRSVRFETISPTDFGTLLEPLFGPAAAGVTKLYETLAATPGNTIRPETSAQSTLGLQPLPVTQWLERQGIR
ncbi:SDR family oxidoreductase [Actinomyces trachealis]|uniref:SDR family oxidoreductase n=1 Tax=Actinomyces trachealis TaxID=2763540 RepID=UPI001892BE33|nr:NmrA family NAD(P)-binding protein [Actinomyces trachealis]